MTYLPDLFLGVTMKKVLRLKRSHPNGFMQHGRYVVTAKAIEFNLNEEEEKLLSSVGPKYWIEVTEKLEAEKLEAEKLEAEKLEAEKLEAEKLEAEKLEAEKLEAEKLEAEKLEAEKLEGKVSKKAKGKK